MFLGKLFVTNFPYPVFLGHPREYEKGLETESKINQPNRGRKGLGNSQKTLGGGHAA